MPLLDHFHPPLSATRHWESFHASWATGIMATLNRVCYHRAISPKPRSTSVVGSRLTSPLGIGLVIVDIVTGRQANLHDDLMRLLDQPEALPLAAESSL